MVVLQLIAVWSKQIREQVQWPIHLKSEGVVGERGEVQRSELRPGQE